MKDKEPPKQESISTEPTHIVGVGASAGGLEAIEGFFKNMPPACRLGFVVVQHLSPDYKSLMVELLTKKTDLKVLRAENNLQVEAGKIYLIPPKKNMTIFHGKIILEDQVLRGSIHLPIDIFLNSLAEDQAEKAVAVILSGTGSDGTRGVRKIKEMGGMVMIQDEESAQFDGMPRAAKSTGVADYILPPQEMRAPLLAYTEHPYESRQERAQALLGDDSTMNRIFAELRKKTKVDFSYYKPSTIVRRIERRMTVCQAPDVDDYLKYLYQNPGEVMILSRELLIGVTSFFRDPEVMKALEKEFLPALLERSGHREIRFWVAGCSTGEEAYTLAILTKEAMETMGISRDVKIFATDLDKEAIVKASSGLYPESIAADLSPTLLSKYFYCQEKNYQVARHIREMVVFAHHNLIKDPPFTKIDLVSCRNLLIYFQPILQQKVMDFFNFSLNPGGILLLGSSETVGAMADVFEPLHQKFKIYKARGRQKGRIPSANLQGGRHTDSEESSLSEGPLDPSSNRTARNISLSQNSLSSYNSFNRFGQKSEDRLINRYVEVVSQEYAPLSLVVNEEMEVLHIIGDSQGYLKVPSGRAGFDVSRMAAQDLAIPLATGIQKVFRTGTAMTYKNILLRGKGDVKGVDMKICPLPQKRGQEPLVVVFLEEIKTDEKNKSPKENSSDSQIYDARGEAQERINDLEQELQFTKENLQATIEELETANEELQATNEELLASNEELQSTNEELQATNEELYTVNAEHQKKITELTELNNDVYNLLTASRIGKLLLDEDLEIRKYSPEVGEIFKILEGDIGRPLSHLNHRILDFDIHKAIREVQKSNKEQETHIRIEGNKWYLLRIFPYHIAPQVFSGVVLSFVDITGMKEAEQETLKSKKKQSDIVENIPVGLFVYRIEKDNLILEESNPAAQNLTGLGVKENRGESFRHLWPGPAGQEFYQQLRTMLKEERSVEKKEISYQDGRINGTYQITAFRLPEERLGISFEDVTSEKESEEANRQNLALLSSAEAIAHIGSWRWDVAEDVVIWSDELYRIFGRDPALGAPSYAEHPSIYKPADMKRLDSLVQRALKTGAPYEIEMDVIRTDGTERHCVVRGGAEKDDQGKVIRLYGSMQDITERWLIEQELAKFKEIVNKKTTQEQDR